MKKTCIQCGKEFELSDNEINFYRNKNLELPKRCKECRQKNKRNGLAKSNRKYNRDGISDRNNKNIGYTNNSKHSSIIVIGIIALLILLFIGGNYAGLFSHESRDNRDLVQSQKDINDQSNESRDSRTQVKSQKSVNDQSTKFQYQFRNDEYLEEHFEKHGSEFGYKSKEDYLEGANKVIASSDSLHKKEAEDGDDLYFLKSTGALVIVSTDGYIRTYFKPEDGVVYYNRQ